VWMNPGTHMVLQQAPAKAAVYGYLGAGATAVKVTVSSGGKDGPRRRSHFHAALCVLSARKSPM
jgi:hypothetical protein